MEIPVITAFADAITSDLLTFLTFGGTFYMLYLGVAIPLFLIPILTLQAEHYYKAHVVTDKTTFDED